jgi:hypothetical protein
MQNVCGRSVGPWGQIHSAGMQLHLSARLFNTVHMVERQLKRAKREMRKPRENLTQEIFVAFQVWLLVNSDDLTSSMWANPKDYTNYELDSNYLTCISFVQTFLK